MKGPWGSETTRFTQKKKLNRACVTGVEWMEDHTPGAAVTVNAGRSLSLPCPGQPNPPARPPLPVCHQASHKSILLPRHPASWHTDHHHEDVCGLYGVLRRPLAPPSREEEGEPGGLRPFVPRSIHRTAARSRAGSGPPHFPHQIHPSNPPVQRVSRPIIPRGRVRSLRGNPRPDPGAPVSTTTSASASASPQPSHLLPGLATRLVFGKNDGLKSVDVIGYTYRTTFETVYRNAGVVVPFPTSPPHSLSLSLFNLGPPSLAVT